MWLADDEPAQSQEDGVVVVQRNQIDGRRLLASLEIDLLSVHRDRTELPQTVAGCVECRSLIDVIYQQSGGYAAVEAVGLGTGYHAEQKHEGGKQSLFHRMRIIGLVETGEGACGFRPSAFPLV